MSGSKGLRRNPPEVINFCATVLNISQKKSFLATPNVFKTNFEVHMKHFKVLVK